jgi:hypothetical protein
MRMATSKNVVMYERYPAGGAVVPVRGGA